MTKRRVHDNPLFCFWEDAICALSFFVRFSEKPGFCGYFLGVRTLGTKNFSAYARKMLIDGYIVHIDTGPVRAQTAELQKIGVNINQIARRINSTGTVYAQDLEDIKGALAQIWQLQRSIISSQL